MLHYKLATSFQKVHCAVYKEPGYQFGKPQRTQGTPLGGNRVMTTLLELGYNIL